MNEHTIIYLAPRCMDSPYEGRPWCEESGPADCNCPNGPHPWVKYVLADNVAHQMVENTWMRKALEVIEAGWYVDRDPDTGEATQVQIDPQEVARNTLGIRDAEE